MAFRARIAQHIEIHRESRFPSLSPSAENRATRFDPRNYPSPYPSSTLRRESATYLNPPHAVLFYSRGTSAFASAATPFNLAPGPIPFCPYLIRLSLASDRFARTCSVPLSPSFLPNCLRVFLHFAKHRYLWEATRWGFQSLLHLLAPRSAPSIFIPSAWDMIDLHARPLSFHSLCLYLAHGVDGSVSDRSLMNKSLLISIQEVLDPLDNILIIDRRPVYNLNNFLSKTDWTRVM